MPRSWEDAPSTGLDALSATLRQLAAQKQDDAQRELLKLQHNSSRLNALAQLTQSIGLFAGEPEFSNEALSRETGGMLQVKPKTSGTRGAELQGKLAEGEAKRGAAKELQNVKFGQQMTLEQVKWTHSMAKIEEMAKNGQAQDAFKALMAHVRTFAATGGPEDVAQSQRAMAQAEGTELTPGQKPLEGTVGAPTGGIFGLGAKTATRKELIAALGSEARANQAEQDLDDIQQLITADPKSAREWEKKFFKEYPVLQGKIGFTKE